MIQRYTSSFFLGLLITFSLLWVMQVLISTGKKALTDEVDFKLGDFILVKQDEITNLDEDEPEPPPEVDEVPETPEQSLDNMDTSMAVNISGANARIDLNFGQSGRIGMGDGDFLPIVKVAPIYPRRAQTRGLDGQCLIEFTVTETGSVKDAFTVDCTSRLFERASINAALKFKYKPRITDGVAVEVKGVQHIITFEIEN